MAPRLAALHVYNLFDLYTHHIPFNIDERITALIAPNGKGKTVCLKLIEALFNRRYSFFRQVRFSKCEFEFADGSKLTVDKRHAATGRADDDNGPTPIVFAFIEKKSSRPIPWNPIVTRLDERRIARITRSIPFITRVSPQTWSDDRTGEELDVQAIIERYSEFLPKDFQFPKSANEPKQFRDLLDSVRCHLIETQRLLVMPSEEDEEVWPRYEAVRRRRIPTALAVNQKSEQLKQIIQRILTNYAALSQTLDRSFPKRIITGSGAPHASEEDLRNRLKELDEKRQSLMSAGILRTEFEPMDLQPTYVERSVARVLEIYVSDTIEKLSVFDTLLAKLQVFRDLLNKRFLDKTIEVQQDDGIVVRSKTGHTVPLDKLSSGEQHQLVLVFDLLFDTEENELILIDEPELSLHVTWQKSFIEDMKRIIALNKFDVILATHSPQLIGRHFNLAVELGGE